MAAIIKVTLGATASADAIAAIDWAQPIQEAPIEGGFRLGRPILVQGITWKSRLRYRRPWPEPGFVDLASLLQSIR